MLKKTIAFLVMMAVLMCLPTTVWAAAVQTDDATVQDTLITMDPVAKQILVNDFQVADNMGSGMGLGQNIQPWYWILSIFITGLGQIFMGEVMRGLMFLGAVLLLGVAAPIIVSVVFGATAAAATIGNPTAALTGFGVAGIVSLVLGLLALAIHIWNIIDAYQMNQGKSAVSSEELMKKARALEQQMLALANFADRAQIDAQRDTVTFKYRAAAF